MQTLLKMADMWIDCDCEKTYIYSLRECDPFSGHEPCWLRNFSLTIKKIRNKK